MKGQDPAGEQELVGNTAEKKNWKGIFIALLVIVIVCALIIVAIVLLKPGPEDEDKREKITFNDYLEDLLAPKVFYPTWIQTRDEDLFLYRDDDGALYQYNCSASDSSPYRKVQLMDNRTFNILNTSTYFVSPDRLFVLLAHDGEHVYRYSRKSHYSIYNVETGVHSPFDPAGAIGPKFQYVGWAPVGHSLVYVQLNNIYYMKDPYHNKDKDAPVQLTTDGEPNTIYNGIPDWVYEEEILSSDHAMWWSPDGRYLLYASFNDSSVRKYYYPFYGDLRNQYGDQKFIPYPKPGATNPTFKLKIVDTHDLTAKHKEIAPPAEFKNSPHYFTSVGWRDNQYFLVAYLNRAQNESIIQACKASKGLCKVNQVETGKGGWVEINTPPIFAAGGERYFWILPNREGNAGYYKHISMVDLPVSTKLTENEGLQTSLTGGKMDVMEIVGHDQEREIVYFIAAPDPRKRHLYSVNSNSSSHGFRTMTCMTCIYEPECKYFSASFSPSGRYYMLGCLGPNVPYYILKSTVSNREIMLESNEALKKRLKKKALPKSEFVQIQISDNNNEYVHGKLLLPPQLDTSEILTYPLLLKVYGGPDTQLVTYKFEISWETYLSSSNGIIIGYVDGRGTAARGQSFLHAIYKRLGSIEVKDTIVAGNHFDQLPYVESSKKAIWGWSHGGFITASVLGNRDPPNPFDCGIAVAPVTDWNYYDSVYTERYMSTPMDNPEGYRLSNISRNAAHFKRSRFMLIHGTGDDNVHFQNSAQLMKAFVEKNVFFRSQIYTDQHHGLVGGNTKRHLHETMEDFLNECFHGKSKKFELKNKMLQQTKQEPLE